MSRICIPISSHKSPNRALRTHSLKHSHIHWRTQFDANSSPDWSPGDLKIERIRTTGPKGPRVLKWFERFSQHRAVDCGPLIPGLCHKISQPINGRLGHQRVYPHSVLLLIMWLIDRALSAMNDAKFSQKDYKSKNYIKKMGNDYSNKTKRNVSNNSAKIQIESKNHKICTKCVKQQNVT